MTPTYLSSTIGGVLIGLSSAIFLLANGRIAGISGIVAGLLQTPSARWVSNFLFVVGLLLGPVLFRSVFDGWPIVRPEGSIALFLVAGLLVGFGTRLGSGCTSGHGVCGLARLSPRSAVAVAAFLAAGVATVALMRVIA
jgi:uncharacterized protein